MTYNNFLPAEAQAYHSFPVRKRIEASFNGDNELLAAALILEALKDLPTLSAKQRVVEYIKHRTDFK